MVKIAIAGGNRSGSTLLSMLRGDPEIEIVGIYEKNAEAPGISLAQKWGIPVFDDLVLLASDARPEIIINVTADTRLSDVVRKTVTDVEIIDVSGARFLSRTLEKQKKALYELFKTTEYEKKILSLIETLAYREQADDFFGTLLEAALTTGEAPAGSIAVVEDDEMNVVAHKGLSASFTENRRWKIMTGGLTDRIIREKELVAVQDISAVDYINNPAFIREGIKAFLACPLVVGGSVSGILYIDDFKPRLFPERQKRALRLLSGIAALSLDLLVFFKTMKEKRGELALLNEQFEKKVLERTEDLERINKALEQANQHKNRFIANMSHELRTPLNSILGFSNILLEKTFGELTENQQRYVKNIHSSGRHLLELVNNVLDIAKIEAGKYEMVYETFRVEEMITEVLNVMKPMAEKKAIDLSLSLGDEVGALTADIVKMKQILYNLLSNAVKFTPEGGKVRIAVEKESGRGEAVTHEFISFSVQDTGVGISPDDIERIFDEFEQADTTFSRKYGGVGLGLALTKKLVELHGGMVTVDSRLGEGSTFAVSIPLISQVQKEQAEEVEAVNLNFPWMNERAPLILVVEDDPASAELLTIHLTQSGYKVAHAFDGEEAVEKATALRPFAILLDIMLPKMDGWEVLQSLKTNDLTSNIPVLIHSIVDNKDLAFALGATDYLLKPLDKEDLLSKLHGLSIGRGRKCPMTILVIDAGEDIESLKEKFDSREFLIYSAREGKRGLELATALRPDVILLDFELPDMLGFDIVKELKESPSTRNIPIFILTEKDISVEERISLVGKIERIIRKHRVEVKELIDHITEIEVLYPRRAGLIDALTGIFSHRYFQLRLAQEVERAVRYKQPLNLMLLDIDSFGQYIKDQGEESGNYVLKKISEILTKNIRGSDVVVRYGGDAFAVVLPNTVLSAALSLGNRFSAIIGNYPFSRVETHPRKKITVSVGLAFLDGQTPEELVLCCEEALAYAKSRGGNRVEIYSKELEDRKIPQ